MTADTAALLEAADALAAAADALRRAAHESANEVAPPVLLSMEDAAARLGIGRTLAYGLVQSGQLRSHLIGRRRLVSESALAAYVTGSDAAD
jgi:excisionase family DNA binding protein